MSYAQGYFLLCSQFHHFNLPNDVFVSAYTFFLGARWLEWSIQQFDALPSVAPPMKEPRAKDRCHL